MTRQEDFDDGYRMAHRPGDDGPGLHNAEEVYPDIHEHPEYYSAGHGMRQLAKKPTPEGRFAVRQIRADNEALNVMKTARGNPEAMVTMHRAVPHGVAHIHPGDWVSTSHEYARMHVESSLEGHGKVISARVPAKHLHATGDGIHEFGYGGPRVAAR